VTEQRGIPFVVNIAAAPQVTEQGYRFIFRNFPRSIDLVTNGLALIKTLLTATNASPQRAVFLHANDTFGQANRQAMDRLFPAANMPFQLVESIAYDPRAQDLASEVARIRAARAELVLVTTRAGDAIKMVREMVRQRFEPMGIVSPGSPGMYDQEFYDSLGRFSDYAVSNVPWYNPRSRMGPAFERAFRAQFPNDKFEYHAFNAGFTLEGDHGRGRRVQARELGRTPGARRGAARDQHHRAPDDRRARSSSTTRARTPRSARPRSRTATSCPPSCCPADAATMPPVFPAPGWQQRG
jgi:branched-chain amino acid transport system substrate-binding protein